MRDKSENFIIFGYLALLLNSLCLEDHFMDAFADFEEEFLQSRFCLLVSWLKQVNFLQFIFMLLCYMVNIASLC